MCLKLIRGVGINDADYNVTKCKKVNGKTVIIWMCPFYLVWVSMLNRCYSELVHETHPSYKDCFVCDEWLTFSKFRMWMEQQDWQGKQLDKDLLVEGNMVYSPDTCVFVHVKINNFIINRNRGRGECLLGVHFDKRISKFISQCNNPFTGKREYLGSYSNELDAHLAWKARKHELACMLADSEYCNDDKVKNVLLTKYT